MLFSHPSLASHLSAATEPVWEKVRDVPKVTIDFGGGRVVRRTLHGNVITWVLDARGRTVDAIPGVMTAEAYRTRLDEAIAVANEIREAHETQRDDLVRLHHATAAGLVVGAQQRAAPQRAADPRKDLVEGPVEQAVGGEPPQPPVRVRDFGKSRIEGPVERTVGERAAGGAATRAGATQAEVPATPLPRSGGAVPDASALREDTDLNLRVRGPRLHRLLAERGLRPLDAALTRRVYRDVLDVNLDDPWLGLGPLLSDAPGLAVSDRSRE